MSTLKCDSIVSSDGNTDLLTLSNGAVTGVIGGRRNLIINGAMQVAQRGTSATGITSGGYYTCDRWNWADSGSQATTLTQSTDAPDGFSNSFKVETTTADASASYAIIEHKLEAQSLQHLAWGTSNAESITLSFWVKSSETGTATIGLRASDGTDSGNALTYTVDAANTWEHKTITFTGKTVSSIANDNQSGLNVWFLLTAGASWSGGTFYNGTWAAFDSTNYGDNQTIDIVGSVGRTFQITGVQLEVGSVATPFEHRSYGEELALCQRYYWKSDTGVQYSVVASGYIHSTTACLAYTKFPVTMRAAPTGVYSGTFNVLSGATTTSTSISFDYTTKDQMRLNAVTTGQTLGRGALIRVADATSYIEAEAEL